MAMNRSRMTRIGMWAGAAVSVLVLLAGGAAMLWFYRVATASLPFLDGRVHVPGLSAPVAVARDDCGIPHLSAETLEDLVAAQAFVTAQDRLWQMDMSRRYGRGELAEVLGSGMIPSDRRHRILQVRRAAEAAVTAMSPEDRRFLDAYARGVNALMDTQRGRWPIEFRVLGYEPRPWTPEDSMVVGINITESLTSQFETEHARERLTAALGPELSSDLYLSHSWRDRWPGSHPPARFRPDNGVQHPEVLDWFGPLFIRPPGSAASHAEPSQPGSNNWVLSGERTASGKPMLSNDMHLSHSIPNVWYIVHLRGGGLDVAGVSFPGLPFVVAGRNRLIAWGYTNLGADVQDLFIEPFNEAGEYKTPEGWRQPGRRRETIRVRRGDDIELEVTVTRHGPIVSDLLPGEERKLALQWTVYDPATLSMNLLGLNLAENWSQFLTALSRFAGASQNVVYADIDGHIGYHAVGWIPIRGTANGSVPLPGDDGSHDWTGYVPFDQLPSVYQPASGIIATANGRVVPDGYPFYVTSQWGSPYRTERIYSVLESATAANPEDMLALQMDTHSEFDRYLAGRLARAVTAAGSQASHRAREAGEILRRWDGKADTHAVAPTITTAVRAALWQRILEPRLGEVWRDYRWFGSATAMEQMLRSRPQRWLPEGCADWDQLLLTVLEEVLSAEGTPEELASWQWGRRSTVRLQHPLFGSIPLLSRWSAPPERPQSGAGSLTVKAAGRFFGASQRATYDMADVDGFALNIVTGQSGQLFSPYYMDQWPFWYEGKLLHLPFSEDSVRSRTVHKLTLHP